MKKIISLVTIVLATLICIKASAPTGLAICPQCDSRDFPDHSLFLPVVLLTSCVLASHVVGHSGKRKIIMFSVFGVSSAVIASVFVAVWFVPGAVQFAKQIATMISAAGVLTIVALTTGELMKS